jgi:hypothetical protein
MYNQTQTVVTQNPGEVINWLSEDWSEAEQALSQLDERHQLQIQVNEGLAEALHEIENLREQFSATECASLIEQCKNTVIETITGQFGLASMFLNARDGGNVTTVHNFETAHKFEGKVLVTDEDKAKYAQWKNVKNPDEYLKVRVKHYNPVHKKEREKKQSQNMEVLDRYTGKKIPFSGADLDHIVPIVEIERNAKAHLSMSIEERVKLACSDGNYAITSRSGNESKNDENLTDWSKKSETARELGVDPELARKEDKKAREYVFDNINAATAKKYTKELLETGTKDAANQAKYAVLGIVMRDVVQMIFEEVHVTLKNRGTESFQDVFKRFKTALQKGIAKIQEEWKENLKDVGLSALTAFLSNIVVFAINLFATTLKKLVSMIRAGFVSLVQAIRILANPPKGMPAEEVRYQALKILTAGIIGAASLGLSAGIEKLLQTGTGPFIPLMMMPLPFSDGKTVSDAIAVTLSGLVGGLLTTIVLFYMDKFHNQNKQEKLLFQLVNQSGVVVQYELAQTWLCLDDAYRTLDNIAVDYVFFLRDEVYEVMTDSAAKADAAIDRLTAARENLEQLTTTRRI